uniref:Uncharacterized protein n=1 Tax=Anopheles culicifacies TaxID=139723 RepID=A0A182MEF0_9DIPT
MDACLRTNIEDPEDSSSLGGGITKIKLENFWHDNDLIAFAEPVSNHATAAVVSESKPQRNINATNATTIPAWRCKTSKPTSKIALPMVTTVGRMMVAKKSSPSGGGGSMVAFMKPLKSTGNGNVILTSAGSLMATTMTSGGTIGGGG